MGYKLTGMYIGQQKIRPIGIPTDNLLGYYPLQSDANDASGNGNNGTWINGANYGTVGGYTGGLFTRGTSGNPGNKISLPITISNTPLTLCCWAYCTGIDDRSTLIGNPRSDNNDGYAIRPINDSNNTNTIFVENGTSTSINSGNNTYTDNQWFSIIVAIDSSSTDVYVNGVKTSYAAGGPSSVATNFYIASFGTGKSYFGWNGYIRDVAIYNKAFTDAEASQYIRATT